jgi:acyl carrier protein
MDKLEVQERVIQTTAKVLKLELTEVTLESDFAADLGAESIQSIELVAAFEEEFGIEMDEDAALQVMTVGSAVDFIHDHIVRQKG